MNPKNINKDAQLLEGVGASSWFHIFIEENNYRIERFSEKGKLECSELFTTESTDFDISSPFKFTYISHCQECSILQNNKIHKFIRKT